MLPAVQRPVPIGGIGAKSRKLRFERSGCAERLLLALGHCLRHTFTRVRSTQRGARTDGQIGPLTLDCSRAPALAIEPFWQKGAIVGHTSHDTGVGVN